MSGQSLKGSCKQGSGGLPSTTVPRTTAIPVPVHTHWLFANMTGRTVDGDSVPVTWPSVVWPYPKVLDADVANSYLGHVEVASTANLLSIFTKQLQDNAVSNTYYYSILTIFLGKSIQLGDVQEVPSGMGGGMWPALWGSWKAWALPSFEVHTHGFQAAWHTALNCHEGLYHEDGQEYYYAYTKAGRGMNDIQTCLYDTNYSQELDASVSLSLDVWTSSNGHAFLAILMHWIDNDWNLGMLFLFYLIPICLLL